MIFTPLECVDSDWAIVRDACVAGRLGQQAKVSTATPNPNAGDPATKVIIVYTTAATRIFA